MTTTKMTLVPEIPESASQSAEPKRGEALEPGLIAPGAIIVPGGAGGRWRSLWNETAERYWPGSETNKTVDRMWRGIRFHPPVPAYPFPLVTFRHTDGPREDFRARVMRVLTERRAEHWRMTPTSPEVQIRSQVAPEQEFDAQREEINERIRKALLEIYRGSLESIDGTGKVRVRLSRPIAEDITPLMRKGDPMLQEILDHYQSRVRHE